MPRILFFSSLLFIYFHSFFQQSAVSQTAVKAQEPAKVLLIPFDPKLYISEADRNINKETKMTFKQIVFAFQKGLDGVLANQFKASCKVVSLLNDTAKTSKDLRQIYFSIDYRYERVPAPGQLLPPKAIDQKTEYKNGQIDKNMQGEEKKFMNIKITNAALLSQLNKKYKTDVFVFINELDIKASPDFDEASGSYRRDVAVHYSVFDKSGKELCAGLVETHCPSDVNVPSKIATTYFTSIAKTIFDNYQKAVAK